MGAAGKQDEEFSRAHIAGPVVLADVQCSLLYQDQNKEVQVLLKCINPFSLIRLPQAGILPALRHHKYNATSGI